MTETNIGPSGASEVAVALRGLPLAGPAAAGLPSRWLSEVSSAARGQ